MNSDERYEIAADRILDTIQAIRGRAARRAYMMRQLRETWEDGRNDVRRAIRDAIDVPSLSEVRSEIDQVVSFYKDG